MIAIPRFAKSLPKYIRNKYLSKNEIRARKDALAIEADQASCAYDEISSQKNNYIAVIHQEKLLENQSLITSSRRYPEHRALLNRLTNSGYFLYNTNGSYMSSFVHHDKLAELWMRSRKDISISNEGIIYRLHQPLVKNKQCNLLVLFSSIHSIIYRPQLRRYFEQNFTSIQKYIPHNTAILRIADIGGVVGAFYLNTKYLTDNEKNIQKLINDIASDINANRIVLYGASKGATAALYHGILGNQYAVAVDPIVSDEYYFKTYKDSHFTKDLFPQSKQEKFKSLFDNHLNEFEKTVTLITSTHSEQYPYIYDGVIDKYKDKITTFVSNNDKILAHKDVSPNTLHLALMAINLALADVSLSPGYHSVI